MPAAHLSAPCLARSQSDGCIAKKRSLPDGRRRQKLIDMKLREDIKAAMSEKLKARFGHRAVSRPPDEGSVASTAIRKEVEDFVAQAMLSDSNLDRLDRRLQKRALRQKNANEQDNFTCVSSYSSGGASSSKIRLSDRLGASQQSTRDSSLGNSSSSWLGPAKPFVATNLSFKLGTSALPDGPMQFSGTTARDIGQSRGPPAKLGKPSVRHHLEVGSGAMRSGGPLLSMATTNSDMGSMYEYCGSSTLASLSKRNSASSVSAY